MVDRLGELALLSERDAQVVVGAGVFRPDLQGALVMFDRLGRLAPLSERDGQVVADVGVCRPDLQGALVMFERLGQPAFTGAHNTKNVSRRSRIEDPWHGQGPKVSPSRARPGPGSR